MLRTVGLDNTLTSVLCNIPILIFFLLHHSNRTYSIFRSHNPANGFPYKCLSKGTTGSVMFSHDFGLGDRGMRIPVAVQSLSGNLNTFGSSSIYRSVY